MSISKEPHFASNGKRRNHNSVEASNRQADCFSHKSTREQNASKSFVEGLSEPIPELEFLAGRLTQSIRARRKWRLRADHRRWIKAFVLSGKAVHVVVTFRRFVTLVAARKVARSVVRWLAGLISGWVKVLERGRGGLHVHFVVCLAPGIDVNTGIESIEVRISSCRRAGDLIGRLRTEPVRDAESIARYLTKSLDGRRRACRYAVTYSGNIARVPWWLAREGSG